MNLKKTLEPLLFFSIRVIEDLTRETATGEKEILTNQPQTKGLTLENWEVSKAIFLEQRLNTYRDSYTRAEKINKELKRIDEMLIDPTHFRTDYGVIKQRYKEYLLNLPANQPNKFEVIVQRLGLNKIALIHAYSGSSITRENAGTIAGKYGYTSKNSGERLYQDYLKQVKPAERTAIPTAETQKTLINKIELFESVLSHLETAGFQRATDEINILKSHLKHFEK